MAKEAFAIKIVKGHCLGGVGNDIRPGQILMAPRDISIAEAKRKIDLGLAERVRTITIMKHAACGATEDGSLSQIMVRDPVPETRDPILTRPRREPKRRSPGAHSKRRGPDRPRPTEVDQ